MIRTILRALLATQLPARRRTHWRALTFGAALLLASSTAALAASVSDWRHDIDEIVGRVKSTHPDPFTKAGRLTFEREADALKRDVPGMSEEERAVRAMRLVASIGDTHTILDPTTPLYAHWYPIRLVEFPEGYFITSAHTSVADLAGAQVLEIAGRPVAEVSEKARDLISSDNRFWRKESLYALHNAALMKGLHYAEPDGSLRIRAKLRSGQIVNRVLPSMTWSSRPFSPDMASMDWRFSRTEVAGSPMAPMAQFVSAYKNVPGDAFRTYDPSRPPHLAQRSLSAHPIPGQDAYYILVNIWQDTNQETVTAFFHRAMLEVDAMKPRRLILDLRYNPGGDGSSGDRVVEEFMARRDHKPWKEFYVLTSGRTYSASLLVMGKLLEHTDATLVGEPAGGALNLYGDYSTFPLPKIGFELRVSALRHELSQSDDLRDVIPVDVPAPMTFADYVAGRDTAVDAILRGDEMRSLSAIALSDGGLAATAVYHDRAKRFSGSGMWSPPSEPDLRRVGKQLLDDKRSVDAIEVFRLNTEIHPDEWRTWYGLGNAQLAAALKDAAMESFRRCLALNDPTNFNAERLAKTLGDYDAQKKAQ